MILTVNCGSSSLKYQLFDDTVTSVAAKGLISRIGEASGRIVHESKTSRWNRDLTVADHRAGFRLMIDALTDPVLQGGLDDVGDIVGVGHRVVHGGDAFSSSVVVDDAVLEKIESFVPLAPLHNPANLAGITEGLRVFPHAVHTAVFDTAFHQTMPPKAYVYPLPYELYEKHGIRRYGFHGTSCRYVAARAAELLGRPLEDLKLVVCHLGNGVTIDAVAGGRSVDTSLGFGTLSGVMMGTRSGDFDPLLLLYLQDKLHYDVPALDRMIHKESGLTGISGVGNDMREIVEAMEAGDPRCRLAFEMFCYMTRKYVGSYAAVMGGIDALVFTAGIGENSAAVRTEVCRELGFLGIELDEDVNRTARGKAVSIGRAEARTPALVVPTDEERMIALDTIALIAGREGTAP